MKRLGVTADYPDSSAKLDLESVIPLFVPKRFYPGLLQKITRVVKDHQRYERAKKIRSVVVKDLGLEEGKLANVSEDALNDKLAETFKKFGWTTNIPSRTHILTKMLMSCFSQGALNGQNYSFC